MHAEVHLERISDDFTPCTVPADSQEVNFAQEGRIKAERQHPGLVHAPPEPSCITFLESHISVVRRGSQISGQSKLTGALEAIVVSGTWPARGCSSDSAIE
jgi:hypothetical protein